MLKPQTYLGLMLEDVSRMKELVRKAAIIRELDDPGWDETSYSNDNGSETARGKSKRGGKKGTGGSGSGSADGGFLGGVSRELFFRRNKTQSPQSLTLIEPSDGHPQEEQTPDFAWFRPLSHNVPTWVLYWPELMV